MKGMRVWQYMRGVRGVPVKLGSIVRGTGKRGEVEGGGTVDSEVGVQN